ncbi:MAG: 50S ribosomal protein L15 [Sumerlaeia bacterium]
MKIHTLPGDPGRQQKRKRVGRGEGSGQGKTAGKGHKGKQARSGAGKGMYFEGGQIPLIRRLPKFGFSNPNRVAFEVVNLSSLDKCFDDGATVDVEALRKARLVNSKAPVKVLANGDLTKKLTVKVHAFSGSAKSKIEAAGGSTEVLPR